MRFVKRTNKSDKTVKLFLAAFYVGIYTANRELYMQDFMQITETATAIKHSRGAVV
ncbi:hypothetical protein Q9306_22745 [Bacillus sp. WLY-B-L8]|nr:hypothetical protein [Bacillus sp. WLY-B-L8]